MDRAGAQFTRIAKRAGPPVTLTFDGATLTATAGDSILSALLTHGRRVRKLEFGGEPRAGFCLMGACQDCWVWSADSGWLRACTTPVSEGMTLFAEPRAPLLG